MKITVRSLAIVIGLSIMIMPFSTVMAQAEKAPKEKKVLTPEEKAIADLEKAEKNAKHSEAFFATVTPLDVTLTMNIKKIRGDKSDKAPWRSATFAYKDAAGKDVVVPAEVRTRGIWRLNNCEFPPLRLNFKSEATKTTILRGLDKPKLVNFCKDTDEQEQYILQEAQLYRIYALLTDASHRMRLLSVKYTDSASGKVHAERKAILIEDPEIMAARNGGVILEMKGALPQDLEPFHDALVGMYQYFVGNTDFSTYALHNVELVQMKDGNFLPVAYDFDFSGAVAAAYATPDPKLPIQNVRFRMFRGYCRPMEDYVKAIQRFKDKKDAIYALYDDEIGKLMKPSVRERALKYYDDFFKIINDDKKVKREIGDDCVKTN